MPNKPIRVYADTSVFGGVFDEEFSRASSLFLEQVRAGRFQLVLSPLIEEEVAGAPENVRGIYESISVGAEMLPLSEDVLRLHEAYLSAGIVSPRWAADALHVAHASVHACQMMVSWNFRHIVHYQKTALYNAINVREGHPRIGIHTPQEVIHYEDEDL